MSTKHCPVCGSDFPRDTDHFYRTKSRPDGLSSRCKKCDSEKTKRFWKEYYPAHREEEIARVLSSRAAKRKEKQASQ